MITITKAIKDPNLFRPFLEDGEGKISTWRNWLIALRVLYGLSLNQNKRALIKKCTGRDIDKLPENGFKTALFLTSRRSGKSRISSVVGAYEAVLSGKEKLLAKGETGMVAILAPTAKQGRIVKNYLRAIFEQTELLQNEVAKQSREGFLLTNGILVEILVGDWRSIRGYTLLAAIVDEVCFFGLDAESKVRNDTELIRALKPSLSTTSGRLICISSPYAERGWAYRQYKKNFGNDAGKSLVWNCDSRTMNPTLSESIIAEAKEEDLASAKSEYLGEFRTDVGLWLPREVIESVVKRNIIELLPRSGETYYGFVDVSGGRSEDAALGIAHLQKETTIIDCIKRYKAPHNPHQVIRSMCETLRRFRVRRVVGDNYAAEFVAQAFQNNGISYEKCKLPKSALYLELLPMICSGTIELLDNPVLINQLAALERRTRSGGRDSIDHPQGGKDDLANVIAGVGFTTAKKHRRAGVLIL